MTIDPEHAAEVLRAVEATETRARSSWLYRTASTPLLIWGVIWFAANLCCQFFPAAYGTIWLFADAIGLAGTIAAVRSARRHTKQRPHHLYALGAVIFFASCAAALAGPLTARQLTALITLTISFCYVLGGIYGAGVRFAVLGLSLMAAIVAGQYFFPDYLYLWLGVIGGGGLCLAAYWIRKV